MKSLTKMNGCARHIIKLIHCDQIGLADVLIDFSFTVKAVTSIFIFGRCSAISSAKQGESGSIYNLVKD